MSFDYIMEIVSKTQEVDLTFLISFSHFYFLFQVIFLYSIFRTRVRVGVARSHCHTVGHIRWHGHKVPEYIEGYRRFWKDDVILCVKHMLTLRCTHGHLG